MLPSGRNRFGVLWDDEGKGRADFCLFSFYFSTPHRPPALFLLKSGQLRTCTFVPFSFSVSKFSVIICTVATAVLLYWSLSLDEGLD